VAVIATSLCSQSGISFTIGKKYLYFAQEEPMATYSKEFTILGQKVVIQDQAQADLATVALKVVNERISEIQSTKPFLGPSQVAVLALLEIAGNLVRDRKSIDSYREELDRKCSILMTELARLRDSDAGQANP
jgi:cell division protein ZapA (FtsZ GTPase activity inhibitor)